MPTALESRLSGLSLREGLVLPNQHHEKEEEMEEEEAASVPIDIMKELNRRIISLVRARLCIWRRQTRFPEIT
jgi:hypothetical protein